MLQSNEYDIAVCGGGFGGISAALAAAREGKKLVSVAGKPADPWNGNTAAERCLFDMGGVSGKYIRIGIRIGGDVDGVSLEQLPAQSPQCINTREIVVYGTK